MESESRQHMSFASVDDSPHMSFCSWTPPWCGLDFMASCSPAESVVSSSLFAYLKADNRMLRERLKGRSLRFSDRERALLAHKAFGMPRKVLLELGTIVTPDTLLAAHALGVIVALRHRCP